MMRSLAVLAGAVLACAAIAPAQSELIPIPSRRDHVWDQRRGVLLIGAADGVIQRFDVRRRTFLPPVDVGDSVQGLDITPDGRRLYVCEGATSATRGFVRVLDLDELDVTTIGYDLERGEAGAWDVAIAANGKAFVSTGYNGSGRVPLRELDTVTDVLRARSDVGSGGLVNQSANIARSARRDLLLFVGSNISSGPTFTYDPASDTFPHRGGTNGFPYQPAVSRDGALLAVLQVAQVLVYDRTLAAVTTLAFDGGHGFDPIADLLYAVDSGSDEIAVLDTATWSVQRRLPIGQNVVRAQALGDGVMTLSDDGVYLFLSTSGGIRLFELRAVPPRVDSIEPARAHWADGPSAVTIRGAGFAAAGTPVVAFAGVPASGVTVVDDATLRCDAPAGEPGPADVAVRNAQGEGVLWDGFVRTPATLLRGVLRPGGRVDVRVLVRRGDSIALLLDVASSTRVATPPLDGFLCLRNPLPILAAIAHPADELRTALPIPLDASLSGDVFDVQAAAGDLLRLSGTWTNCARVAIR